MSKSKPLPDPGCDRNALDDERWRLAGWTIRQLGRPS